VRCGSDQSVSWRSEESALHPVSQRRSADQDGLSLPEAPPTGMRRQPGPSRHWGRQVRTFAKQQEGRQHTGATGNFGALPNPPNSRYPHVGEQFLDGGGEQRRLGFIPGLFPLHRSACAFWSAAFVGPVRRPAFVGPAFGPAAGDGRSADCRGASRYRRRGYLSICGRRAVRASAHRALCRTVSVSPRGDRWPVGSRLPRRLSLPGEKTFNWPTHAGCRGGNHCGGETETR
jgi:hypothetical protein